MKIIGITGPSGSGKSRISAMLREHGYPVIDVDVVARELRPKYSGKVKEVFGKDYINDDGSINTRKLALLVFNNRSALAKLNEFVFPAVMEEMRKIIEEYRAKPDIEFLFFDIAVLFHSGAEKFFDQIVLITAPRLTRLERLIKLRKTAMDVAIAQVDSVFITHDEINRCNLILVNDGDEKDVHAKLLEWINKIKVGSNDMSKITPVSPISTKVDINPESRNRDLQKKHKEEFSEKLQKAIKDKKKLEK